MKYLDGATSLEQAVFQALGAASACWGNLEGAGVFQAERAMQIGEELLAFIYLSVPATAPVMPADHPGQEGQER